MAGRWLAVPPHGCLSDRRLWLAFEEEVYLAAATLDGELFPTICHPKKKAYLIAFAETGNKVQAAKAAGGESCDGL